MYTYFYCVSNIINKNKYTHFNIAVRENIKVNLHY